MANKDLISNPSRLSNKQAENMLREIYEDIESSEIQTEEGVINRVFGSFKRLFSRMGKPTMIKRHIPPLSPPYSDIYNETMKEVKNDLDTIFEEGYLVGEGARHNFNYTVAEREKLRNKIKKIGEYVSDYTVTAKGTIHRNIVIQDNFTSKDKIDESKVHGSKARISTSDGIVTLEVTGSEDQSRDARLILNEDGNMPGNGLPGNFGVAIKDGMTNRSNELHGIVGGDSDNNEEYSFLWTIEQHDDPMVMFDGKPDTWFEYGAVNIPEEAKKSPPGNEKYPDTKGYGWHFSNGDPIYYDPTDGRREVLKLTVHIELPEVRSINWISLEPYIPPGSGLYMRVLDVKTSRDDSQYVSVNLDSDDPLIIGSDTNRTPFGFTDVIDKYTGKGVWAFPARDARFIKIDIETDEPYQLINSLTGKAAHIYWTQSWTETKQKKYVFGLIKGSKKVSHKVKRVEGPEIDKTKFLSRFNNDFRETGSIIIDGLAVLITGIVKIFVNETVDISNLEVSPGLDIYDDGWRWCIGVKNIEINSFRYSPFSRLISREFNLPREIDSISLSVAEMIPEEFYRENIATKNDWIRYYISVDDGTTWHRISPLEHSQVSEEVPLPPKTASVNSKVPPDSRDQNRLYINYDGSPRSVRLRVDMYRPENSDPTMTPTLSHYQLRILPREDSE